MPADDTSSQLFDVTFSTPSHLPLIDSGNVVCSIPEAQSSRAFFCPAAISIDVTSCFCLSWAEALQVGCWSSAFLPGVKGNPGKGSPFLLSGSVASKVQVQTHCPCADIAMAQRAAIVFANSQNQEQYANQPRASNDQSTNALHGLLNSKDDEDGEMVYEGNVVREGSVWKLCSGGRHDWQERKIVVTTTYIYLVKQGNKSARDVIPLCEVVNIRTAVMAQRKFYLAAWVNILSAQRRTEHVDGWCEVSKQMRRPQKPTAGKAEGSQIIRVLERTTASGLQQQRREPMQGGPSC
eukprot:137324-Hanusia_phi.AAC.1